MPGLSTDEQSKPHAASGRETGQSYARYWGPGAEERAGRARSQSTIERMGTAATRSASPGTEYVIERLDWGARAARIVLYATCALSGAGSGLDEGPVFGLIGLALGVGVAALVSPLLMAVVEWMQRSLVVQEQILRALQRDGDRF